MKDGDDLLVGLGTLNARPQGKYSLAAALRHNKRTLNESAGSNIDPARSYLNYSLLNLPSTPAGVLELSSLEMERSGYSPKRVDSAIAVEGMFSLRSVPAGMDIKAYFSACASWLAQRFGGVILSADVHLDEPCPHCHVIVQLPLIEGGKSGSKVLGGRPEINGHCQDFFVRVGRPFGLRLPGPKPTGEAKRELSRAVHAEIRKHIGPLANLPFGGWLAGCIDRDPVTPARELGIPIPAPALVTIAQLARRPGKGPKTAAEEAARDRRELVNRGHLIGVAVSPAAGQRLSCVGVGGNQSSPVVPNPAPVAPVPPTVHGPPALALITRERESDRLSSDWDEPRGEMRPAPPAPAQSNKAAARAWVESMLLLQEETA